MKKVRKSVLLRFIVTAALFGLILSKLGGFGEIARVLKGISPAFIVLTIAAITVDRALMTFKWGRLLAAQGSNLGLLPGMKIYCASMVSGIVLPMSVGADAVRTYMASRIGLNAGRVVASIVVERAIGFLASLVVGLAGFVVLSKSGVLHEQFGWIWWTGGGVLVLGLLVLSLSFNKKVYIWLDRGLLSRIGDSKPARVLREFQANYRAYGNQKRLLASFFGLSVLEQLTTLLYMWLVAIGLGVEVGLLYFAGALPLALLISRLPITFHGLGLFDGVFALLLSYSGVPMAQSVAITLGVRILELAAWFPWWLAYLVERSTLNPAASTPGCPELPERP